MVTDIRKSFNLSNEDMHLLEDMISLESTDENEIILNITVIRLLQKNLMALGYSPTLDGCCMLLHTEPYKGIVADSLSTVEAVLNPVPCV